MQTKLLKKMKTIAMRWAIFALCILPFCTTKAQVAIGPEVGFTAAGIYNEEDVYAGINLHIGATAHIR